MKNYSYTIYFDGNGYEIVTAGCFRDAVIIGCAERMKKGRHIRANSVTRYNDKGHAEETLPINERDSLTVNWGDK